MTNPFRPMLAADISAELTRLRFPVYVTPKLDGVRALITANGVFSRSMKPIPNAVVQKQFAKRAMVGLDGELIVGDPTANDVYRTTQSVTSRESDSTPVTFYAFDIHNSEQVYSKRLSELNAGVKNHVGVCAVPAIEVYNLDQLATAEQTMLAKGFEGCILRTPNGRYKQGRSTVSEQGMLKLKRFVDGEAEVIGVEEEMHNGNVAQVSEIGRTKRSSAKANLSGKGTMGALVVRDLETGVEFKIGTGFTSTDREWFWTHRRKSFVVKYKHFLIGVKDKPRFPVYLGLRDGWDK
jgi:DNA ligase 1